MLFMAGLFQLLLLLLLIPSFSAAALPSTCLSSSALLRSYGNMIDTFKIFIYAPTDPVDFSDDTADLFYHTLQHSPFLTVDPARAHLFFVPLPGDASARSLGRVVREVRHNFPFWNRTLGSDHFFISPAGIGFSSDRNVLELKKNSIQVSVFPVISCNFIPHKDVTLPPIAAFPQFSPPGNSTGALFLGYMNWDGKSDAALVRELKAEEGFLVEEKSEPLTYIQRAQESKFCLFLYRGDLTGMTAAMASGCVPVVIVHRPIQDLPLMKILRWSDFALFVAGGADSLKRVLNGVSEDKYGEMKQLCKRAATHLRWSRGRAPEPFDAFHMVMHELWLRRHAVRYTRRDA